MLCVQELQQVNAKQLSAIRDLTEQLESSKEQIMKECKAQSDLEIAQVEKELADMATMRAEQQVRAASMQLRRLLCLYACVCLLAGLSCRLASYNYQFACASHFPASYVCRGKCRCGLQELIEKITRQRDVFRTLLQEAGGDLALAAKSPAAAAAGIVRRSLGEAPPAPEASVSLPSSCHAAGVLRPACDRHVLSCLDFGRRSADCFAN